MKLQSGKKPLLSHFLSDQQEKILSGLNGQEDISLNVDLLLFYYQILSMRLIFKEKNLMDNEALKKKLIAKRRKFRKHKEMTNG